jgi:beta-lactam-binding protein with PASTA domain
MMIRIFKIACLGFTFILVAGISAYFTLTVLIKSEDTVIVPDLVGKDVVYVLELLSELELNTKVKRSEYVASIPKNYVVFQHPDPGSEIKKGRDVKIILSKGPKRIAMPNLITLSFQQANIILEENGICQGALSRTFDNTVEKDRVIAQLPAPNSMISRGECVDLLVSLGSRSKAYKMPDLAGLALEDALQLVEKMNLTVGEIKSSYQKNKPRNIIIEQDPLSGYRVIAGSPVNLVINRKLRKKEADRRSDQTHGGILFSYRLENGFLKRRIRVKLNSAGFTSDIFDDYVKAGEEIWLLIPRDTDATVFLYEDDRLIKTQNYAAR